MATAQIGTEFDTADLAARPEGTHHDPWRFARRPAKGRTEAQPNENAARIRRELQAGPDLAEPRPPLDERHFMPGGIESESGSQASNARADDSYRKGQS